MTRFLLFPALIIGLTLAACSRAEQTTEQPSAVTETEASDPDALAEMGTNREEELNLISELGLKPYGPGSERTDATIDLLLPAPWDSVVDVSGAPVSLQDIMGPQGAVLVFNRSAEWCPYCQKQMIELEAAKSKLAEEGMTLTVLTYDNAEVLSAFADKHDLSYTFVSDTDSSTIALWGLLNDGMPADTKYAGVPHPGFAMISPDGDIKGLIVKEDYKIRPSVDDIVREAVGFRDAG